LFSFHCSFLVLGFFVCAAVNAGEHFSFPNTITSFWTNKKCLQQSKPIVTGTLFAVTLQTQCFPMNNRPHKKEKPKKRSKKYFAKKVVQSIHSADLIVHYASPKS